MAKLTPPAPQNIRRREAFFLTHAKKYPTSRVQAELSKIAMERADKKLRWEVKDTRLETMAERMEQTKSTFQVVEKKKTLFGRIKSLFTRN